MTVRAVAEETRAIKKMLKQTLAGKSPSAALLKKLGPSDNDFYVPRKPAPRTAQALKINQAIDNTQKRISARAVGDDTGEPPAMNAMDFHALGNQSLETRMQRLEGRNALPLYRTPESLANATTRLINRHPLLSAEEKLQQSDFVIDRAEAMRVYLETANIGPEETARIMHKTQLDMMTGQSEDPMLKAFEKNAGRFIEKKAKKEVQESVGSATASSFEGLVRKVIKSLKDSKKVAGTSDSSDSDSDESAEMSSGKRKQRRKARKKAKKAKKDDRYCSYCKSGGHTVEKCFKKRDDEKNEKEKRGN